MDPIKDRDEDKKPESTPAPPNPREATAPGIDTSKEDPRHFRPIDQLHPDRAERPKRTD
jgi:hypothetical protein